VKFADPANGKYPIDSPGHSKAVWAYIHQPENAASMSPRRSERARSGFGGRQRRAMWRFRTRTSSWSWCVGCGKRSG